MQTYDAASISAQMHALTAAFFGILPYLVLATIVQLGATILINWRIVAKSGYPGVASLLYLVPGASIAVGLLFAFVEWPIERRLKARSQSGSAPPALT